MGYYEPDCGYYEPSEFEEEIEKLKQCLRDSVSKEIEELKAENARMKDIVDNYDAKMEELENLKWEQEWKAKLLRQDIEAEIRKQRLSELLEPYKEYLWGVDCDYVQGKKCSKCDANRMIHFKSPQGNDCTEKCSCAVAKKVFKVVKLNVVELHLDEYSHKLSGHWCEEKRYGQEDDDYSLISESQVKERMYHGQPYKEIKRSYMVYFKTEEEAQGYVEWLNGRGKKD